jgi:hypothetical protein
MMRAWARTAAITGAAAAVAAMVLPWALYGDIGIRLNLLPGWGFYVAVAAALNLTVGWDLMRPPKDRRLLVLAGVAMCVGAIGAAVTVMLRYDDGGAIFDGVVPLVVPAVGLGGPLAIVAALASGAALVVRTASAQAPPATDFAKRYRGPEDLGSTAGG